MKYCVRIIGRHAHQRAGRYFYPHIARLGRGVGVGVQREAGGVVAEGVGEGFHIYAVFQGQSRECMTQIMKSYVFCSDGLQYLVVGVPEGVGVEHGAGLG